VSGRDEPCRHVERYPEKARERLLTAPELPAWEPWNALLTNGRGRQGGMAADLREQAEALEIPQAKRAE